MNASNLSTKLTDIRNEPGVVDLPLSVGGKFAQAIKAEREGDIAKAEAKLIEAVAAEDALA